MITNVLFLAAGIAALTGCALALRYFAGEKGQKYMRTTFATYVLIYAVMAVGGAGLIFVGYGFGLDEASARIAAKRLGVS